MGDLVKVYVRRTEDGCLLHALLVKVSQILFDIDFSEAAKQKQLRVLQHLSLDVASKFVGTRLKKSMWERNFCDSVSG